MRGLRWAGAAKSRCRLMLVVFCLLSSIHPSILIAQPPQASATAVLPLKFDEEAEYALSFKGFGAATAGIRFLPGDPQQIKASIKTNALTSLIFAIQNRYAADLDSATGLPLRVHKDIDQKNIKQNLSITYNRSADSAFSSLGTSWPTLANAMDLFSMLFQLRMRSPAPGDALSFALDIEGQAWLVTGETTAGGEINCPFGCFQTRCITLRFNRHGGPSARAWKTDLLTNRIARPEGGMLTIFLGPPPDNIPVLLQFGPPGQQVVMRLKDYKKGK